MVAHSPFIEKSDVTVIRDEVCYVIPMGFLGRLFGGRYVRKNIENMFTQNQLV